MYKVVFTKRALKDLENIDKKMQNRIAIKLKGYAKESFISTRKLISQKIGTYRFRIGDYRVIFDIDGENIVILRIGHRRDIYNA
uniref:Toxin RelE3 n=1 Tax=Candidatus Methanophaga sp. ANME-1 ERB7 TaxID=2759913 RepID=A0A7G9Z691_9EURY|nr:toxin RelE3 [Methanosarcinales archaeon ANME-1 ERB7]